jgi:anaerobic magnesium-protoporphyrin IX monomethyl ester cyclase
MYLRKGKADMRILLLSPPYKPEYMRNARCDFVSLSATQWYPILLGYCGAYLEGQRHEVKLIDAPAQYLDHKTAASVIMDYRPDLIVLYTGFMSEKNDLEFTDPLVEKLKCEAVITGPYASIDPEGTLFRARVIDKLITGEFEHPVGELAAGKRPQDIKNLLFKEGGRIKRNPERDYLNTGELDAIPFVSRFFKTHLKIYDYKTPSEFYPFIDIMTGRGCKWGLCTYCLWVHVYVKGRTYNLRSINNVMEELRFMERDMTDVRSVMVQDDTFTANRAREFCEAKMEADIKLPWSCYARADIRYEDLKLMKKAGCRNLHVGYESGSDRILSLIAKGLTAERMNIFTRDAKRAGLRVHGDFAIGFPGETKREAMETIRWAHRLNPDTAQFQLMIPFPGTPFYKYMKEMGWLNVYGQPDMPNFTNEEIRAMAKMAYRKFYLSPRYLCKCLRDPREHFFNRLKTIKRAVPAMFWKNWEVSNDR